ARAVRWAVRAGAPRAGQRAGTDLGQIAMPDLVRILGKLDPLDLGQLVRMKEAKLHALGVRREQREVRAFAVPGRAERRGFPSEHSPSTCHSRVSPSRPGTRAVDDA